MMKNTPQSETGKWGGRFFTIWSGGILCVLIAVEAFSRPIITNVESYKEGRQISVSESI